MTKAKIRLRLEMAYDLVAETHSAVCVSNISRKDCAELSEDFMEILRRLIILDNKIRGTKWNER